MLAGICGATSLSAAPPKALPAAKTPKKAPVSAAAEVAKWAENEALVEWRVGRVAAACNEVSQNTSSAEVRREVLRLKAAYATSSYAILSGRNPLVQTLDLLAMAVLNHEVWIEEGRAKAEFGDDAKPLIAALEESLREIHAPGLAGYAAANAIFLSSSWTKSLPQSSGTNGWSSSS